MFDALQSWLSGYIYDWLAIMITILVQAIVVILSLIHI